MTYRIHGRKLENYLVMLKNGKRVIVGATDRYDAVEAAKLAKNVKSNQIRQVGKARKGSRMFNYPF